MKKLLALSLSLTLLTACASAPADSVVAVPEPAATPAQTATPAPEPTAAPTMAAHDPVSLDDWKSTTAYPMPEYSFSAPHKPQMEQKVRLPESGKVQLLAGWNRSLEEAAETYGIPAEQLQAMNPDATWDRYENILLQE